MNLDDVVEELRAALDTITDLRVPEWGVKAVTPPAALVALPQRIEFDQSYVRGTDQYPDLEVFVLVANPADRRSVRDIAPYCAGAGPKSVKQAIESYPYTSCHPGSVRVVTCEFESVEFAKVPYLAAIFHVDLTGDGE
jgi:hypothetical protein